MIKATFRTLMEAVDHGRMHGGWIFQPKNGGHPTWYDASTYTISAVIKDGHGEGTIAPWRHFDTPLTR